VQKVNPALALDGILALIVVALAAPTASAGENASRPTIQKLGTIDLLMVETRRPSTGGGSRETEIRRGQLEDAYGRGKS